MTTISKFSRLAAVAFVACVGSASFFLHGASAATSSVTTTTSDPDVIHTSRPNAGQPNSDVVRRDANGNITAYGNSAIIYKSPSSLTGTPESQLQIIGQALYQQNCSTCHGANADGQLPTSTRDAYPSLRNLGPAVIDFWISSGRMPAADPTAIQAARKPPRLTRAQGLAIAAWINSLGNGYPYVPVVNTKKGDVANGLSLFALNCAACHTITGGGDALAQSTYAPSLHAPTVTQIVEAIRTGPGNMPNFAGSLSDAQVRDIATYVSQYIQHPRNPGGAGLGGLGPVAEGFIGLALGVGLLALAGFWVGERQ